MIEDGIYKVFKYRWDDAGQPHRRLAARIMTKGGMLWHLEDHYNLSDLLPEGPVTGRTVQRFQQLQHNGYYEVVHEDDVAEGHHPEHIEELDVGDVQAEHRFIMTGDGIDNPATVELWDHAIMVDGRRLPDEEAHQLLNEVQAGRVVLTPIEA